MSLPDTPNRKNDLLGEMIYCGITFVMTGAFLCIIVYTVYHIDPKTFLQLLYEGLKFEILRQESLAVNPYRFCYILIAMSSFFVVMPHMILSFLHTGKVKFDNSIRRRPFYMGLYALIIVTAVQLNLEINDFRRSVAPYKNTPMVVKKASLFSTPFIFAQECKRRLPGPRTAMLLTDFDIEKPVGMSFHRYLCYFLYPIDLRISPQYKEADTIITFNKQDAMQSIPKNFRVIYKFSDSELLAVRDKIN